MALILIVEDDPVMRELFSMMLSLEGHEVREAENGEEALERIREGRPDLLVADLVMPVMDGHRLLARLPEVCADPPPVLVLSAVRPGAEDADLICAGADRLLQKPVDPAALVSTVQDLLGGR